jgi:hypothetical protein
MEGTAMKRILTLLAVTAIAGCSSATKDIKVDAVADGSVDFSKYRTYEWVAAAAVLNDPNSQWKAPDFDVMSEVQSLVDDALQKRGMTEVSDDPDMLVAFGIGADMDALGVKEDPNTKTQMIENVPQGALVLFVADGETGYVSWVGEATGDVQENIDEKTIKKRLDYAISQLIKKLPK